MHGLLQGGQAMNALEGVVFADDNQVARLDFTRSLDRSNPRVELTITETPS